MRANKVSSATVRWSATGPLGGQGWRWLARLVALCCVSVAVSCLSACHFDSQPLFEPLAATDRPGVTRSEPRVPPADAAPEPAADSGEDSDSGMPPVSVGETEACTPDEVSGCDGNQLLICDAAGRSMRREDCGGAGCNAAAKRCNSCRPSSQRCNDDKLVRCDADGMTSHEQTCDLGCVTSAAVDAACRKCAQGTASCRQDELVQCAPDGQSEQTTRCAQGCDDKTLTCKGRLVPTNIPRDACSWTDFAEKERTITSSITLDTERDCPRVISQGPGLPDLCVLAFEKLRVERGATVRVTGPRALVLLATKALELEGRISVSARGAQRGAGGVRDADSGQGKGKDGIGRIPEGMMVGEWTNLPANAGGGGGGHLTPGAAGGGAPGECGPDRPCAEAGAGGASYGAEALAPLRGGSSGGQNSAAVWSTRRGAAGGGGGALQLVACEELKLGRSALLDANGGGGQGGQPGAAEMDSETPGAGAGGGSGGAILLQARKLTVEAGAALVANGGGGGGGATRSMGPAQMPMGMPGNMPMMTKTGEAGEDGKDGQLNATPASGGQGAGNSQPGGAGGAKDPPADGGRARQKAVAAGGGGGASGRIRIETAADPGPRAGILMSPSATYGTVAVE